MSDLVERLRDWASNSTGCNPANAPCAEAADEIERLREALREIAGARPRCCEISDAMQYIARAALKEEKP